MASVINTNMASLYAQKNLSGAQNALSTSVERLSSGLRINRAKDDAAGLGISEKIKSQVVSLNQGIRNANDAISMVQTAEGSLSEVSSILQRMKELSVQARNDSLSTTQRSFISDELVALKKEINAIAERTTFNDLSLLKNALRTDVVASTAANRIDKGATVLTGITVSDVTVKNANAGTYTFTAGTAEQITGQVSRANSPQIASAGADNTQAVSQAAATGSVTVTLSGVYEVGDTITWGLKANSASTGTVTYTIKAEDFTANGDGTGGSVTGGSATALNNIANRIKDQFSALTTTSVSAFVSTVSGSTLKFEGTGVAFADALTAGSVTATNRTADTRSITFESDDVAEGNLITLTVNGRDYSMVVGSEMTKASVAAQMKAQVLADFPATATVATGAATLSFLAGSSLSDKDISLRVRRLDQGTEIRSVYLESSVSPQSISTPATARTIQINDYDVVLGRKFTVSIGNPETTTEYSVVVDSDDTASTVAAKLEDLIDNNLGQGSATAAGTTVASNTITIGSGNNLGMANIQLKVYGMTAGEDLTVASTVNDKARQTYVRTVTINQADMAVGNVVSVMIGSKEYATKVTTVDNKDTIAAKLASLIDNDYGAAGGGAGTNSVTVTPSGSASIITLGTATKLGLEDISVSVKRITNPGRLTITADANTGIGGTSQSLDIGTIAAGGSKTFDFDNLGISFTLANTRISAVSSASFESYTSRVNQLQVGSTMDGNALFQVGAGTRDTVVLDGFKDIRITGYNQNAGAEKAVFDNINTTLNTIAQNTTESLSEANFATLENQIEDAITTVADFRGYFGAQQNRIEFAISNIQAQSENLTAANSRIRDTDYAAETANLTKTQIMQQAATAMLAQANQMPNVILALLK